MHLEKNKVKSILDDVKSKHIAVIGDLMLDEYLIGKVDRISPEAPVPGRRRAAAGGHPPPPGQLAADERGRPLPRDHTGGGGTALSRRAGRQPGRHVPQPAVATELRRLSGRGRGSARVAADVT